MLRRTCRHPRRTRVLQAAVFVLVLSVAAPALAEVGVSLQSNALDDLIVSGPYVLIIIEDPTPFGPGAWRRFHTDASHAVLNEGGEANGDGPPSALYNPVSKLPIVAWARNSAQGFDIVVSVFRDGSWSTPQTVAGGAEDERDPFLFLAPNGDVHLVYWTDDGVDRAVWHRQAPPDLSSWSAAAQVSQPGEAACRPAGVFHDGVLRVAYEAHPFGFGATPRDVVLAREENGAFVPQVLASTQNSGEVRPQVHSFDGKLWVDWVDDEDPQTHAGEAAWLRLDPSGRWEPTRYESFASVEERDFHVRGAIRLKAIGP